MLSFNPFLEIFILTPNKNRTGFIRKKVYSGPSRSFLKQWVQGIKANFSYVAEPNTRDTTNILRSHGVATIRMDGAAGVLTRGIILGTGNTPVTISDYKVEIPIAHGPGAGQLNYYGMVFDLYQVVGSTASFRFKRQMENLTAATITVKEIGVYYTESGAFTFCMIRDVLGTPIDLLPTKILEVRYTFKATV